jgi:hypothetical protein
VERKVHLIADMAALRTDLSYAFRLLRKSPGFSALAIGWLALGIAANVVIFSIVNGVLLKALDLVVKIALKKNPSQPGTQNLWPSLLEHGFRYLSRPGLRPHCLRSLPMPKLSHYQAVL